MCVVGEVVEDGVAEGGLPDMLPVLDGDLARQQGAAVGVEVGEDLEQVVAPLL